MKEIKKSNEELKLINECFNIRNSSKMTQKELGDLTGLSQSTIARIENNNHSASLNTFIKLLNGLGYHLEIKKN